MKKLKQIFAVAALAFCCSMAVKADTQAAQITGVKQVDDSRNSVDLSCNTVLGTEYYVVELSQDNKNWTVLGHSYSPNSITVRGLAAGQSYYARITGASDYDYSTGAYTASTEPSAPIEVVTAPDGSVTAAQSDATTNSISVKSSAVAGANYYVIRYNNQVIGQGASTEVKTSARLNPGTSYWIYTYACRRTANGSYTAYGSYDYMYVKTLQQKINKNSFGISSALLNIDMYTFAVNSGLAADGYHFELQNASGKVKNNLYATSGSSVTGKNLKGTFYKYRVRSFVNCGSKRAYSAWSDFHTIGIAKKVTGKYVKGNKLRINWSKISGASGYTIYASNKENSGYKKVKTLSAKKRNVVISKIRGKKIKKNKLYYIRIIPKAKKVGNAETYGYYSYRLRSY